ncbi:hypothetical protein DM860_014086 [Cuscuta australis]|uniref:RNA helicase n=1 Tax=Cuscuta australis TaxID=267555 RepID=A0A328DI43_9ASTE|nr:hypothetical protein DM860_014086 [Cuscuta australis]
MNRHEPAYAGRPHSSSRTCGYAPGSYYKQQRFPSRQQQSRPLRNHRGGPPGVRPSWKQPNFTILLRLRNKTLTRSELDRLVEELPRRPHDFFLCEGSVFSGKLFYQQWSEALEVIVFLWRQRLDGKSSVTPFLEQNVEVSSDKLELGERIKDLFLEKLEELLDGELVQKGRKKLALVLDELDRVSAQLRKPNLLGVAANLLKKKEAFLAERDLISKRIEEFKNGVKFIMLYLKREKEMDASGVSLFQLDRKFDWDRIHHIVNRECRRLEDGLPIFSFRQEILSQIRGQQVTLLTGETGSGKSTQLVQFLADSGIGGNDAIVCTQPRKLAATSLANRVKHECLGCYEENSVSCYQSYSSKHQFDSKVIFMTDHCLLQQYMSDNYLSKISCILVDEVHERSLNTDLLLALLRNLLQLRPDMRLIIMSATADANQLANYFFGCGIIHVAGRTFPVDIKYAPCESEGCSGPVASYVSNVVKMVLEIHNTEGDGTILAFLTSQVEVEWACEKFCSPSAVTLPLHGKLSGDDQNRIFFDFPGKRKVIFTTNIAETSLTIPGVKYVVDCGLMKQKWFEPGTGTSVLRVCMISRSSANQRAGRAGRTEPGKCYRLFPETDFESMPYHEEPEICRVHLGIALLRILALGIKDVQKFEFIDAPSSEAIEMTFRSLIQLGAITQIDDGYKITDDGRLLVKLGIEPRLGKMLLSCFRNRLGREGVALATVMANSSSIFCRVGTEVEKLKSDCQKVQFCHPSGDLFTLLSVYKEWDDMHVPPEKKNRWCWDNSINAKTMRRCQETLQELEACLQNELRIIIPSYWRWNPRVHSEHDKILQSIILSSLAENVAMYSGYDRLGYQVALTGKHIQLHPSCSLLNFCQRPSWVVFDEILVAAKEYLVCATAFDFTSLMALSPPPSFDFLKMDARKLQKKVLTGLGSMVLKRFCGKSNTCLNHLVSRIRTSFMDERIGIEVDVDHNEILLYASSGDMDGVLMSVNEVLEHEHKILKNECLEKCTYKGGSSFSASFVLFGAGAVIRHLELDKRCLTIDIYHSNVNAIDDKKLLMFLERNCGDIGVVHKFIGSSQDSEEREKWGRVTFISPKAANLATALNSVDFNDGVLTLVPSKIICGGDQKIFSSPLLKARICWPRRSSRGTAIVKCNRNDVTSILDDFSSNLIIGGRYVHCARSTKTYDSIVISGVGKDDSESEIFEELSVLTPKKIIDVFFIRGDAVEHPSLVALEEALLREISSLMPKKAPYGNSLRVQVFQPEPNEIYMRATITFDGNLHLEAAKVLEQMNGKVLPGCFPWQKIKCQRLFHSSLSCSAPVYHVIRMQLDALLARFRNRKGVECSLDRNENGSYRVKITANATKIVAEVRKPFEEVLNGKVIEHEGVTPTVLQHLFSWEGISLMRSIQQDTGTYILFDKHNVTVRIFGSPHRVDMARQKFVESLLALHESKQLVVHLRGETLPPDLMKRVVQKCGPDLNGLKEMFPEGDFSLNIRHHCIHIKGSSKDLKQRVEDAIYEIAQTGGTNIQRNDEEASCPICLCQVDDGYRLEACLHQFCRSCLVDQCESAIRSRDGFPLRCLHRDCGTPIIVADLKSLLTVDKLEELFRASLSAYVAGNPCYRFCPSPDCPSIYHVGTDSAFVCGACYAETCTRCHLEYHPDLSCEKYREFKDDPDLSLKEWSDGKENVKKCPVCKCTIEKVDGCNHVECRCGKHVCWVCLEVFEFSDDCYNHLRSVHLAII